MGVWQLGKKININKLLVCIYIKIRLDYRKYFFKNSNKNYEIFKNIFLKNI